MQGISVLDGIFKHLSAITMKKPLLPKMLDFVIQYLYFVTFNWDFFPVDLENNIPFSIGNITEYRL
jgi:hypothetical protein